MERLEPRRLSRAGPDAGTGGRAQPGRQQSNAVASRESIFRVLQLSFEFEGEAAGRHLEAFALALALAVAILLQHAQPEPDERDDRHERRRANRQGEPRPL